MNRKRLLKIAAGSLVLFIALFVVLVIHVGQVTVLKKNDKRSRQLSRIDFKEQINADEAAHIRSFVSGLNGVSGVYFNDEADILTYMYDPAVQNSSSVYAKLVLSTGFKAERYVVDNADIAKGCPAFAEKGTFSKVVLYCSNMIYN